MVMIKDSTPVDRKQLNPNKVGKHNITSLTVAIFIDKAYLNLLYFVLYFLQSSNQSFFR